MPVDESARRAIVARRQRLIATALAALGNACGPQTAAPSQPSAALGGGGAEQGGARQLGPVEGESSSGASTPDDATAPAGPQHGALDGGGGPAFEGYDADRDGVPDSRDRCPDQAGVDAVDSMQAGCPARPCLSMVAPSQIEVSAKIYFDSGQSDLKAQAQATLETVARALHDNPELELEAIGHCDSTEPDDLALQRARKVRAAILARAISPARVGASGEGSRRPVSSNATAAGRAQNRRVEFVTRGPKRPLGSPP